jgi:FKBP-type peptidyl-prolyl cis-trans isomerase SlpA
LTTSDKNSINQTSKVTMNFSLSLEDGTLVDSTFDSNEPLTFTMGDGTLIDGLEYAVVGLSVGDKQSISIEPGVGFGFPDESAIQTMKCSDFGKDIELKPGVVIEFDAPSGLRVPGTILEVDDDTVKVDFSHPLAGRTVIFNVEILDIQQ